MLPAQDLQKLQAEIETLKARVTILEHKLAEKKDSTISKANEHKQCIATTTAGNQCSRDADPGSNYCWQHKKIYEPTTSSSEATSTSSSNKSSTTSSGRDIQTGPRGGKYYINSSGKKVYVKEK